LGAKTQPILPNRTDFDVAVFDAVGVILKADMAFRGFGKIRFVIELAAGHSPERGTAAETTVWRP